MKITLTNDEGKVFEKDINKEISNLRDKVLELANQAKATIREKAEDFKCLSDDDIDSIVSTLDDIISSESEDNRSDDNECDDCYEYEDGDYGNCYCEDDPYEDEDCYHTLEEQSTDPSIEKNYSDNKVENIIGGKGSIIINGDIVINILG